MEDQTRRFSSLPVHSPATPPFQQHATYQLSDTFLTSHVPQIIEDRPDEVFTRPGSVNAAHCAFKSTSTHISNAREPGDLTNKELVAGNDDQRTEEIAVAAGGEETEVTSKLVTVSAKVSLPSTALQHASTIPAPAKTKSPSMTLRPMSTRRVPTQMSPPSTALQPTSTTRAPEKSSPQSTALRFTSTAPFIPCSTPTLHQGPTMSLPRSILLPHSFAQAIPQPPSAHLASSSTTWSTSAVSRPPSMASRPSSTAPHIPNFTTNLCLRPATSLQHPIPLPRSFTNAIPQLPACLSSKGRHPQHFVSPVPTYPVSITQKRRRYSRVQP